MGARSASRALPSRLGPPRTAAAGSGSRYARIVLERVTLGQTRFAMPGIAPDSRGIVLGKLGALLFPALDGVVRWLRLYADEESLDDLLPGMRLQRVVTPLGSRAGLLFIPALSSYVLDRAARCARLAGGATYTGTTRHFVRYRDQRAPHGYDVVELPAASAGVDHMLHAEEAALAYTREADIDVPGLILRLSLTRVPGAEQLDSDARSRLYLTVAGGLAAGLLRYLTRACVAAEVAALTYESRSAFAAPGEGAAALIVRARDVPARLVETLRGVPGVTLFRPVGDNIAVEVGYRHPVALTSVISIFKTDRFYLFHGAADRLDIVAGPLELSPAEHLGPLRLRGSQPAQAQAHAPAPSVDLGVEIQLVPTLAPRRRIIGTLVPWEEAERLKKLVYVLPPVLLRGHQIAPTARGILLIAGDGVDVVPLGSLLVETAPGLLVPVGMDLQPRVPTEVLLAAITHGTGPGERGEASRRLTVFPREGGPFFVGAEELAPLERRLLARMKVPAAPADALYEVPPPGPGQIVNDAVGRFALWGFQAPRGEDGES